MAGENVGVIEQISIGLAAIGGAWIAIFKYMGLSKAFDKQAKENNKFKDGVNEAMVAQGVKISSIESDVAALGSSVKEEFNLHRDYLHDNYMDEGKVRIEFKRLETARIDMFQRLDKKLEKIEQILTDERTREIEDLKQQLRDRT